MDGREKALAMFPTPYPGECLYSIFCRYHQRSGNRNYRTTIMQLFGSYRSFNSSVLSPYRLYCSDRWYCPETGIDSRKLMMENTAYQYYSLNLYPWKKQAYLAIASGSHTPQATAVSLSHEVSNKDYMCYCPECAAEDRKLYGETYWHILPQIDGVEFCPRHKCRILPSGIKRMDVHWHLIPAGHALKVQHQSPVKLAGSCVKNYLELAEDSEWMLLHGADLDYNDAASAIVQEIVRRTHNENRRNPSLYHGFALDYLIELITGSVNASFLSDMMLCYKVDRPTQLKFLLNSYAIKLLEIRCLYGSVENFYKVMKASAMYVG